nr:hypothetical protein Iba_chr12bCG1230 [Ipomoea batatas]
MWNRASSSSVNSYSGAFHAGSASNRCKNARGGLTKSSSSSLFLGWWVGGLVSRLLEPVNCNCSSPVSLSKHRNHINRVQDTANVEKDSRFCPGNGHWTRDVQSSYSTTPNYF